MSTRKLTIERLTKIAEHLESGKLGHSRFDFSVYNGDASGEQLTKNGCGYCGCAIGEMPFIFPKQWKFMDGFPVLKGDDSCEHPELDGEIFLGLSGEEFNHLFVPEDQVPDRFGGELLFSNSTREDVAANIRAFIAKLQEGQI